MGLRRLRLRRFQQRLQKLAGVGAGAGCDLLRRAADDDPATAVAAVRAKVNDMVRNFNNVEVVFNDEHGIARVHEPGEHFGQLVHVAGVQAGGRFVQDINRASRRTLGQLGGELDPLRFAARKSSGRLADLDIAQADVVEGLQLALEARVVLEEGKALFHRHFQHVAYAFALVFHFEGFAVVALSLTHFAGYVYIGQKVHLDFQDAVAFTGLAPAALDVKGEPARTKPAHFALGQRGEQVADVGEQPGVGCGIGAWRAADGRLIDVDDFVEVFKTLHTVEPAGPDLDCAVELDGEALGDDLAHERRLARSGYAGDADKRAQGQLHIDVPEVVLPRAAHDELMAVAFAPLFRDGNELLSGQVLAGDGIFAADNVLHRALRDDIAAVDARAGADVHDLVGGAHGVLVVLYYDQRVAKVAQLFQCGEQFLVILLVQADARLVQNIDYAHQRRTDLGRQPDALAFAA